MISKIKRIDLKMKKLFAGLAAALIIGLSCVSAFAAGINSSEASVLNNMRTPANMKGNSVYVPASYINQAESYFNTIDMTTAQAGKINSIIGQARSFLGSTGKSSVKELSASERKTLINYASAAAAVLNLSAAAGSDDRNIKVITKNGKTVVDDSTNIIKTTGAEESVLPYVASGVLTVLLSISVFGLTYLKRKSAAYEEVR